MRVLRGKSGVRNRVKMKKMKRKKDKTYRNRRIVARVKIIQENLQFNISIYAVNLRVNVLFIIEPVPSP